MADLVSFDGIPAHIPDSLTAAIRRRVDQINAVGGEQLDTLKPPDTVTVQDGPFGYQAILDACLLGETPVRVFLKLLSRQHIPLELPRSQIQCKKQ